MKALILLFTTILAVFSANAQLTWVGNGDGVSWNDPNNWDPDIVPTSTDDVTIPNGFSVVSQGSSACKSLLLEGTLEIQWGRMTLYNGASINTGTLINKDEFIMNSAAAFTNNGTFTNMVPGEISGGSFTNGASGTFSNTGSFMTGLTNNGSFDNNGGIFSGSLNNNGSFTNRNNGDFKHYGTGTNTQTLTNENNTLFFIFFGGFTNSGTIQNNGYLRTETSSSFINNGTINNNNSLHFQSPMINNDSIINAVSKYIIFNISSPPFNNNGVVQNSGSFQFIGLNNNSTGVINNSGTGYLGPLNSLIVNDGTINNSGQIADWTSSLTQNSNGILINDGWVRLQNITNNGTLINNNGIEMYNNALSNLNNYSGTGQVIGNGFNNEGVVSPGSSPGCLAFEAGYNNGGGTLNIEINGIDIECDDYDKINITGTATLSGTLNVTVGYTPTNGDMVSFLEATSISGVFSTINLPTGWSLMMNHPSPGMASLAYSLLPIELTFFSGTKVGQHIELKWQTASETNSSGFRLQRSGDGKTWETIAQISSSGESTTVNDYSYLDERPLEGMNYYRLQQVDLDGQTDYSNVVVVEMSMNEGIGASLTPNPSRNIVTLTLPKGSNGSGTAVFYDITGGKKDVHSFQTEGDSFQTKIDISRLTSGIYFVEIIAGETCWVQRLLVD